MIKAIFSAILYKTSPQYLPLGAASCMSALKNALPKIDASLVDMSYDEALNAGYIIEEKVANAVIASLKNDINEKPVVLFWVDVWNAQSCVKTASLIKNMQATVHLVAVGPEITRLFSEHHKSSVLPVQRAFYDIFDTVIIGNAEDGVVDFFTRLTQEKSIPAVFASAHKNLSCKECAQNAMCTSPWLDGTLNMAVYNGAILEIYKGEKSPTGLYGYSATCASAFMPFERLKKEIDFFAQKNVPIVWLLGGNLFCNKKNALQLLELLGKKLPQTQVQCAITFESIDKEIVGALCNVFCSIQIQMPFFAPSQDKSNVDKKTFAKKIALLNDAGLVFGFDLVYGGIFDTYPLFRERLDTALNAYPNHIDIYRAQILPGTSDFVSAQKANVKQELQAPYTVLATREFSKDDLLKADHLAFATMVFYSFGRAVSWFLWVLKALRIKPSVFLQDFAEWQRCNNCAKSTGFAPERAPHSEIEKMQLNFLQLKFEEKNLQYALPAVNDIVRLYGALSRAGADGEEVELLLQYHPDDILSPSAMDILSFADEFCMQEHKVRVFLDANGPDFKIIS